MAELLVLHRWRGAFRPGSRTRSYTGLQGYSCYRTARPWHAERQVAIKLYTVTVHIHIGLTGLTYGSDHEPPLTESEMRSLWAIPTARCQPMAIAMLVACISTIHAADSRDTVNIPCSTLTHTIP